MANQSQDWDSQHAETFILFILQNGMAKQRVRVMRTAELPKYENSFYILYLPGHTPGFFFLAQGNQRRWDAFFNSN